jgi:hypothetical protein
MIARRHNHGAVAASIRRASRPCWGSTQVAIGGPEASWRVGFRSRTDPNRDCRDWRAWRPSHDARRGRGIGPVTHNGAVGPKAAVALRAPSASGPTAPSDSSFVAQTATDRPMIVTERHQVVGGAPLLILRRQK